MDQVGHVLRKTRVRNIYYRELYINWSYHSTECMTFKNTLRTMSIATYIAHLFTYLYQYCLIYQYSKFTQKVKCDTIHK